MLRSSTLRANSARSARKSAFIAFMLVLLRATCDAKKGLRQAAGGARPLTHYFSEVLSSAQDTEGEDNGNQENSRSTDGEQEAHEENYADGAEPPEVSYWMLTTWRCVM